jgi:hypothetical protein
MLPSLKTSENFLRKRGATSDKGATEVVSLGLRWE